jgi:mannose-6-phosphate isomerase-like protein (cupin superfamily)
MKTGTTIKNNLTGETITMLAGEEENGGARQLWEVRLPPRRLSPPLHYHINFAETLTAIEGMLDLHLGPERRHVLLNPRESVTVEIGRLHTFANERDTPAVTRRS